MDSTESSTPPEHRRPGPPGAPGPLGPLGPLDAGTLRFLLAGLMAGAGVIHLVMAPIHAGEGAADAVGFAVVGWAQVAIAVLALLGAARRPTLVATILVNVGVLGLWVWSRTAGLPFGAHSGIAEPVALIDGLCAGLQVAAILVAGAMLVAPRELGVGRLAPALAAVAVLGLTTVVVVSPDTARHDHNAAGHTHDDAATTDHFALMAAIDRQRCDLGLNPTAYWKEARALGVDTYAGGAMAPHFGARDLAAQKEFASMPGTPGLDELVSATSQASGGEGAAARLVAVLSGASAEDYGLWRRYMLSLTGAGATAATATAAGAGAGHVHGAAPSGLAATGHSAAPDDNGGHGGHVGPAPWVAMTDRSDCAALAGELDRARATAMRYPTVADAVAAGYQQTTTFVPGIAAHYMKFDLVDGTFDIEQPEMLLYDGNAAGAHVVGLSYYLLHAGDAEPTQGFTGPNDHFHRHVGLCMRDNLVIGDSTTTVESCAAMGGTKATGGNGWMNHVWVVPGCESPWGTFSGASPVMDPGLTRSSAQNAGGCAGSGVRDRYDLSPGSPGSVPGVEELAAGG